MKLTNEFEPILQWAVNKGIIASGDPKTQTVKLGEEFGELCRAVLLEDKPKIADSVGDIVVVLTSIAAHHGLRIEECINKAYAEIKDRTGAMVDGNFVKQEDLDHLNKNH